eukprot:CAMPEP_0117420316 /NCGR_PEP_ID=MMETSP0758-20121206/1673_1 /TAXON_ID=63605 /ORGANISM="Percolomonas cosmopolitus, Strain AE-1 (ATCC 50343)" /LENGTH=120 /DNA_ID=CAMNT_0005201849 /DNA_START=170 /DNA_END=529 /DNA_ORIENTATION=-
MVLPDKIAVPEIEQGLYELKTIAYEEMGEQVAMYDSQTMDIEDMEFIVELEQAPDCYAGKEQELKTIKVKVEGSSIPEDMITLLDQREEEEEEELILLNILKFQDAIKISSAKKATQDYF